MDAAVGDTHYNITCANCAMSFYVPKAFIDMRIKDHLSFYCPAGHKINYPTPTDLVVTAARVAELEAEVARLRGENVRLIHRLDQAGVE